MKEKHDDLEDWLLDNADCAVPLRVVADFISRGVTPTFLSASSEAFLPREPRGRETSQLAGRKAGATDNPETHVV